MKFRKGKLHLCCLCCCNTESACCRACCVRWSWARLPGWGVFTSRVTGKKINIYKPTKPLCMNTTCSPASHRHFGEHIHVQALLHHSCSRLQISEPPGRGIFLLVCLHSPGEAHSITWEYLAESASPLKKKKLCASLPLCKTELRHAF